MVAGRLPILLGKLNGEIVAANPKRDGRSRVGRGEFGELDEGEALNCAEVWRRNVHVLGNIDVANGAIRLKGSAEKGLKVLTTAWEVADDEGLDDLTLRARAHGRARALQSGPRRAGRGKRRCDGKGWGSGPCESGGGSDGSGITLLKLAGIGPGEGAVADAPHNGVGIAEWGDGAEQGIKPVGALPKAKCWISSGSHG